MGKSLGSREQREKSRDMREQVIEENNHGATHKFLREQGDSKNNLGSSEKLILGAPKKIIQGAGRSGLNFEASQEPRPPTCRGACVRYLNTHFGTKFHKYHSIWSLSVLIGGAPISIKCNLRITGPVHKNLCAL